MSLEADVQRMAAIRPFSALPPQALPLLAFASERLHLKAGATLFERGEAGDGAYLVLAGEITLSADNVTRRVGPGALIGETALLTEVRRGSEARVSRDAELLKVPRAAFRRVLDEFPETAVELRKRTLARAKTLLDALEEVRARRFDGAEEPG